MADLATLRARLRLELHDQGASFEASVTGNGLTDRFELPVDLVATTGLVAIRNGSAITSPSGYTMDYLNGVITLASPLADGQVLDVSGTHYETFLDSELDQFISTAFLQHTHGQTTTAGSPWAYADLPGVEDYLVVILAMIQALWVLATDASRNIDIVVPDGVSIPESQRFGQVMTMIQTWQLRYNDLSAQLNVGLGRIQMYTLRRVSRLTNRLVPVYVPQEYDEITPPVRVMPTIDSGL